MTPTPPPAAPEPVDEREQPFSRRTLWWVVGLATLSFALALVFAIFGDELGGVPSAGSDSYSRSALGHSGFLGLLHSYDIQVVQSRHDSGARAGERALLMIAEPSLGSDEQRSRLDAMLKAAARIVIVLPKRNGTPDPAKRAWIDESSLVDLSDAAAVVKAVGIDAEVVRPEAASQKYTADPDIALPSAPGLVNPQLLKFAEDANAEPLLFRHAGVLVAGLELEDGQQVVVISDPDLIANHGLTDGDNAAIALAAVEHVRPEGAVVVIDETLHGHISTPSLWRELFTFPLSLASASVLIVLAILLWSAMGRFGKPLPPLGTMAPGKRFLIDNTAELIRYGGHAAHALERYLHATVQDVARASHAPAHLGPAELRDWLLRAARARKVETDLVALEREVADVVGPGPTSGHRQAVRALATAGRIHRWRQEMTNGSAGHSRAS